MGKTARVLSSAAAHTAASIPARRGFTSTAARGFMKNEPEAMFGYANKINEAIDGLEKTIALAKSGFAMVSSSLPTQDANVLASQLEADLVTAQREVIELSELFPQSRYFCAGSLGRLAKTTGDCRDYLTGLRAAWDPNMAQDKRKIADDLGTLHRRLKKDIGKFRKDVQQVAKSQKQKITSDMQMTPSGFDNNQPRGGWGFGGPAAGQGWGGPVDIPGGPAPAPPPPQMQTSPAPPGMAAANGQGYGAPFGYGGDPSMMMGYPNGGMPRVGGGSTTNLSLGPAAYGGAYGYSGGSMVPYTAGHNPNPSPGAALMPFGPAAAAPAFAPYVPQQKPALPMAPMNGQLALAASSASAVQWDPEGRLRYFHPSHQSWYFCPMGSEQGMSYYFHPITQEKYFLPNAQRW